MDTGVLLQAVLAGLASGAVLGLVALGFTLLAGTLRVLQLAHGEVVVAAVLIGVLVLLGRTPVAVALAPGASVLLVLLVLATGTALSLAVGALAVRPALARPGGPPADPLGVLAGTLAAGLLLRELLGLLLPARGYAVPDPLHLAALAPDGLLALPGGTLLEVRVLAVLALGLGAGLLTERLLVRSRTGRALRALADDPDAAALCGVPVRRTVLVAFAVAGLLAGLAALLDAPARAVGVDDGVVLGLSGAAAALLGGLGSLRGALAGGLALGVLQALVVLGAGARWSAVVPLAVLVLLLAAAPRRLLGAAA